MRLSFLFLCLCCSLIGKPLDVEISARSAILMNADTGAVLYEKQAYVPTYPASVTKIATALFILDKKNPPLDQKMTVSGESLKMKNLKNPQPGEQPYWLEFDGTMMGLKKGEILPFDSLFHGLMLVSGNDAANVLAESLCGSISQFVEEMNEYVKSLGCENTQFCNPHGLHDKEHYTTPYDVALLTKKALQFPKFREVISTLSYKKPKTNKQESREIFPFNQLIKPGKKFHYSKAIGGKTGYHAAARNNLTSIAQHEGRTLIAVVLGCEKNNIRYQDTIRLFEAAFAERKEKRRLVGPENIFTKEVAGGKTSLKAAPAREVAIEYYPAEEPECKAFVHWNIPRLPIRKGQKVGEVHILGSGDRLLQKGDLVAQTEVKGTLLFVLKDKFDRLFGNTR